MDGRTAYVVAHFGRESGEGFRLKVKCGEGCDRPREKTRIKYLFTRIHSSYCPAKINLQMMDVSTSPSYEFRVLILGGTIT
jgi:hypothetical protein